MNTVQDVRHPAPFSQNILDLVLEKGLLPARGIVLDPMAGIGRIHMLATETRHMLGVEIEEVWAAAHPDTIVGDATALQFGANSFDAVMTSPCYGNRYADHHNAADGSYRRGYTHDIRAMTGDPARQLSLMNSGRYYAWNPEYEGIHRLAWREVYRVLKPGRRFILNVSDFVRYGRVVEVVAMHIGICTELGFKLVERYDVPTPRMRYGANSRARVETEAVLVFVKPVAA